MSSYHWPDNTTQTIAMRPMGWLNDAYMYTSQIYWQQQVSPTIPRPRLFGENLRRDNTESSSQVHRIPVIMNSYNKNNCISYNKINDYDGITNFRNKVNSHTDQKSNNISLTKDPIIESKRPNNNIQPPIKSDESQPKPSQCINTSLEKPDLQNQEIIDITKKGSNEGTGSKSEGLQKSATKMIHLREKLNLLQQSLQLASKTNSVETIHHHHQHDAINYSDAKKTNLSIHGNEKSLGLADDIRNDEDCFTSETAIDTQSKKNTGDIQTNFRNERSLDDWKTNRKRRKSYEPGELHSYLGGFNAGKVKRQHSSRHGSPEFKKQKLHLSNVVVQSKDQKIRSQRPSSRLSSINIDLIDEERNELLSRHMWNYYEKHKQSKEMYISKMKLRDALYDIIKNVFPYCGLYIIGSSMNGFGSCGSDMDLCLMLSHNEIDQKREAIDILRALHKILTKCAFLSHIRLIQAKVPILKFTDTVSKVECDLNINNSCGIRNTHLLSAYSSLDDRVPPLVLFVKQWAKSKGINDASQGTISSYSFALMVIHYLQQGCNPPLLPSLQQKYPHKFDNSLDIRSLTLSEKLAPFASPNNKSLAELFTGFINYFNNKFCFEENAISVRLGRMVPRSTLLQMNQHPNHSNFICIEEPFNATNTAYSVFNQSTFQRIVKVFEGCDRTLRQSDVNRIAASLTSPDDLGDVFLDPPDDDPLLTSVEIFTTGSIKRLPS